MPKPVLFPVSFDHNAPAAAPARPPSLHQARRSILVVDLVGSTRLMQRHEAEVVAGWVGFMSQLRRELLPAAGGRLVKSLGDGALAVFDEPLQAVRAAHAMQQAIARRPPLATPGSRAPVRLLLRVGLHVGAVYEDAHDIYGDAVNVAVRIGGLARAGEVLVSEDLASELVASSGLVWQDLGECFVKHRDEPLRIWRLAGAPEHERERALALTRPATALDSAVLLRATRALLHGGLPETLGRVREWLDELVGRHGRDAEVQAALADWRRQSAALSGATSSTSAAAASRPATMPGRP